MIAQVQQVVQETDFSKLLPAATRSVSISPNQPSTALDNLVKAQTEIVLNGVLPQVKPELEKFIEYKIRTTAPLPSTLSHSLAVTTVKALFKAVDQASQQDPKEAQLFQQLLDKLLSVLGAEWRSHGTAEDLQLVLIELLEKTKQEYIRRNEIEV